MCCKDFDPESDFERRRRKQAQAKLEDVKKLKRKVDAAAKKKPKGGKKNVEDE